MAENLPRPITVVLNSWFFFPHSTMQSHPASILTTGMFNFFTGTKEKWFSSLKSTTQCVGWTVGKNVSCWHLTLYVVVMERGLAYYIFTSECKSGSVYLRVTQEASVMAKVCCTLNCAVALHVQFVVPTFEFVHWQSNCQLVGIFQLSVSMLRCRIYCLSQSCSDSSQCAQRSGTR